MAETVPIQPVDCPVCGYHIVCTDHPPGSPPPAPHSLIICFGCTNILRFNDAMQLADPGPMSPFEFSCAFQTKMRVIAAKQAMEDFERAKLMELSHGHRN